MSDDEKKTGGFNWTQFWVVGVIALLIGGLGVYTLFPSGGGNPSGFDQAYVNSAIANATKDKDTTIANLQTQIATKSNQTLTKTTGNTTTIVSSKGYLLDEIYLSEPYSKDLTNRQINLFNGKVDFNGNDYDAKEIFSLKGIQLKANEKDFDGNAYLTASQEKVSYAMTFSPTLKTSDIGMGDNGTLQFNFLGKPVEISSWDSNEITFIQGDIYTMTQGDNVTIGGKNVQLKYVGDGKKVIVSIDGVSDTIKEGSDKKINGLDVYVSDTTSSSYRPGIAILRIGTDVLQTISDGDSYTKNDYWKWNITSTSVGLTLSEDFTKLDGDFTPLKAGESICLPNNYTCMVYNGATATYEDYTFNSYNSYIRVKGNFVNGVDSYDYVYINQTGEIYSKDGSTYTSLGNTIDLGDSKSNITTDSHWITINDFRIGLNLSASEYTTDSWSTSHALNTTDYAWRTNYGIFIDNPKTSAEDKSYSIKVPDDRLQGTLTVTSVNSTAS